MKINIFKQSRVRLLVVIAGDSDYSFKSSGPESMGMDDLGMIEGHLACLEGSASRGTRALR